MFLFQVKCIDNNDNPYRLTVGQVYDVREISYRDGVPAYYYLKGVLGGWHTSRFVVVPMGRSMFGTLNP
jgi:hypothetical protein